MLKNEEKLTKSFKKFNGMTKFSIKYLQMKRNVMEISE